MAFNANVIDKTVQKSSGQKGQFKKETDLTSKEIEIIVTLLKQTTFPVKDIESLYIALYKLQQQYQERENESNV